jgi:hypothetical protein
LTLPLLNPEHTAKYRKRVSPEELPFSRISPEQAVLQSLRYVKTLRTINRQVVADKRAKQKGCELHSPQPFII